MCLLIAFQLIDLSIREFCMTKALLFIALLFLVPTEIIAQTKTPTVCLKDRSGNWYTYHDYQIASYGDAVRELEKAAYSLRRHFPDLADLAGRRLTMLRQAELRGNDFLVTDAPLYLDAHHDCSAYPRPVSETEKIVFQTSGKEFVRLLNGSCDSPMQVALNAKARSGTFSLKNIFRSNLLRGKPVTAENATMYLKHIKHPYQLDGLVSGLIAIRIADCAEPPRQIEISVSYEPFTPVTSGPVTAVKNEDTETLKISIWPTRQGYLADLENAEKAKDFLSVAQGLNRDLTGKTKRLSPEEAFTFGALVFFGMMAGIGESSPCWDDPDAFGC